jgi:ribose transport system substrate-binding protein
MNDGDYQQFQRDDCLEVAARYGFPVRAFSAENDSQKQVQQIQRCLDEKEGERPTVAIINPVNDASILSVAHSAARLGIAWALLMRRSDYLTELRQRYPKVPIFSIAADQEEVGRIQGRQVTALTAGDYEVVCIRGPLGASSATRRFEGLRQILGRSRNLFSVNSDWTSEGGERAMNEWFQVFGKQALPKFIIVAQNDAIAMGARRALLRASRVRSELVVRRIPLLGCDGSPGYGQRMVTAKDLTATVIMPPGAGRAIDEIVSMLAGGPVPPEEIVLAPSSFPELRALTPR